MAHKERGKEIRIAINISLKKSLENNVAMSVVDAPTTFRMLISFCLFCAEKAASPNKPRQEIIIASAANHLNKMDSLSSLGTTCALKTV